MAQQIEFEGVVHEFPDDFSPDEISQALQAKSTPAGPLGPPQPRSVNSSGPASYSGPSYASPPGGVNNPEPGLGRSARLAAENTVSTASKIAGTPVDLAAMVLNAPIHALNIPVKLFGGEGFQPLVQNPVGGSQWLQQRADQAASAVMPGYAPIADQDKTLVERGIKNITEFAGQGAAGGTGLARIATTRLAGPATAPRIGDSFLRTYADRPGAAVAADTAAGAGSGAAVTAAQHYAPDQPLVEFGAGIVGAPAGMAGLRAGELGTTAALKTANGLTGGMGTSLIQKIAGTGMLGETAKTWADNLANRVIPNDPMTPLVPVRDKVADQAAVTLQNAASNKDQALGNLRESTQFFGAEGLPQPTAGLQSNDIGLIGLEQNARRANSKPFIESDARVQEAAANQVAQMKPDVAPGDMRLPQQMAQERANRLTDAGERRAQRAEDSLNLTQQSIEANDQANRNLAAPVRAEEGGAVRAEASRRLDEQVTGALDERTATKNAQFNNLPDTPTDARPILATVARIREQNNALRPEEQMPTQIMARLDALAPRQQADPLAPMTGRTPPEPVPPTAPLNQLVDVRKSLATMADKAQKNGSHDLVQSIRDLKAQINEAIDTHPDAAAANAYYREEYAPFFAQGRGKTFRDKVQRDPNGRQDLPPERVAEFWLNHTEDSAAHLSRIMAIAPDPAAAQAAARQYLISDLARSAMNPDGTVNPVLVREWMANNRGKLSTPELAPIYNEIEQMQRNVLNNRAINDTLAGEVTRLNQRMRQIARTNKDIERAIDNGALGTLIKNDPVNAAKEVIATGGDPLARAQAMNKVLDRAPANIRQRVKDAWGAAVVKALEEQFATTRNVSGTETSALSYAALSRQLKQNDELLREVFRNDPDKLRNLNNARQALEVLGRRAQQATTGSQTSEALQQQKQYAAVLEAGLKAYYGVLEGGGRFRTLKVLARAISKDDSPDVARLVERAFTENPRIMEQLLTRQIQAPKPGYNQRLNRTLGAKEALTDSEDERKRRELRITVK